MMGGGVLKEEQHITTLKKSNTVGGGFSEKFWKGDRRTQKS